MADADLDDFFAKKDKGKKKSKSKIKPDDILAQADKPKKKKKPKAPSDPEKEQQETAKKNEDAEWEEVVEEETDYSGLRIQTLLVSNKEEDENEAEEGGGDGEGGEGGERREEASGPWVKLQGEEPRPRPPPPEPEQPKKVAAPEAQPMAAGLAGKVQGGKYVPPARRAGGAASTGSSSDNPTVIVTSSARRKPKVAPNLRSESDFPTLGGAAPDTAGAWQFAEVRSGGRQAEDPSKRHLNLQLDNKFGALQDD